MRIKFAFFYPCPSASIRVEKRRPGTGKMPRPRIQAACLPRYGFCWVTAFGLTQPTWFHALRGGVSGGSGGRAGNVPRRVGAAAALAFEHFADPVDEHLHAR